MIRSLLILLFIFSNSLLAKDTIVLIPGAFSSGDQIYLSELSPLFNVFKQEEYFKHLHKKLLKKGYPTFVCLKKDFLDKWTIAKRAHQCEKDIKTYLEESPQSRFHLIGYSAGGLVGRKILESIETSLYIDSVTTISTPNDEGISQLE